MIERKKYLEMCQAVAVLGTHPKATDIPDELKVYWMGKPYYPVAYRLEFGRDGSAQHFAILHDLHANSTLTTELCDVVLTREL